jgi:hypothetical protein
MKYLLTAAAIPLLLTLATTAAQAAGPRQGIQIVNNNYVINDNGNQNYNHNTGPNVRRSGYDYGRRSYPSRSYRSKYHSRGFESHNEAVARIRATHSRFRTNYHPRSYYNSPPHYYDW